MRIVSYEAVPGPHSERTQLSTLPYLEVFILNMVHKIKGLLILATLIAILEVVSWPDIKTHYMRSWGEVIGPVNKVEEFEGDCHALIGEISVCLPLELAEKLLELKGKHIGILRTDEDFRIRILETKGC